ncbi:MAG: apolipoprotein N-acyltransferase [Hyphomicrobiaceae bacterium]|nr:apolipoprotein N-acyltransferase [Hyphomicrobiaceae bacterium]
MPKMPAPRDVPTWLCGIGPWSRRAVAAAAGGLSLLAMAPFHLWPVLLLTLPALVWLIDAALATAPRRRPAHAAAICWWFAFGYFLPGLLWIGEAFLVEAEKFAVLMPFAVLVMPAGLALFWAGAGAAAALAWMPGWRRVLVLALSLSAAEWLRGHILTGFPWNVLGYALTAPDLLLQSAAVLGIYGLTLVAVAVLALPLVVWHDAGRVTARTPLLAAVATTLTLALMAGWGALRLHSEAPQPRDVIRLRLVQPSIPQRQKWQRENQRRNFERHLELTGRNAAGVEDGAQGVRLVVWPEAAMPFLPLDIPEVLAAIGRALPEGAYLAAGLLRVEPPLDGSLGARRRIYNSLAVFGSGGQRVALYDKIHLVPFGEYLPFQATLEAIGLEQLTRIRGGFDIGTSPRPLLAVPGLPRFGPLICYEAIFPGAVIQGSERPAVLLNVTNDGWFGNTIGPQQHLHQARVRAVEEGLPLIRSANNGVSAVIDAQGRVVGTLGLDVVGVLDADLPGAAAAPLYARVGDLAFVALWLALLLIVAARGLRDLRNDTRG